MGKADSLNTGIPKITFLKHIFKIKWMSIKEAFIVDMHINTKKSMISSS